MTISNINRQSEGKIDMRLFGQKKESLLFEDLETVKVDFRLPSELSTQVSMIGLTELDIKRLHSLQPIIQKHADGLVGNFYDTIMKESSLMKIIDQHSHVDRLRKTMYNHIIQIFSGNVNEEYVQQRKRIAHVHVHIGLGTKWYVNAFQQLMNSIVKVLYQEISNKDELYEAVSSLQKIFSLEQQLVLESYELKEEANREEQAQQQAVIKDRMRATAHELSAISQETSASLEELVTQFSSIRHLTDDGQQAIQKVEILSEDGKVLMGEEKKSADSIKTRIVSLYEEINQLFTLSQNVDSVVESISSIASQINLLALNASIESARAGEHGRGFAVVANEIRNLSNLTKQSTENINKVIKEMSAQVQSVNHSVKEFNENITKNQEMTEETLTFFNEIVEAVKLSKEKTEIVFKEIKHSDMVLNQINEATAEISRQAECLEF